MDDTSSRLLTCGRSSCCDLSSAVYRVECLHCCVGAHDRARWRLVDKTVDERKLRGNLHRQRHCAGSGNLRRQRHCAGVHRNAAVVWHDG